MEANVASARRDLSPQWPPRRSIKMKIMQPRWRVIYAAARAMRLFYAPPKPAPACHSPTGCAATDKNWPHWIYSRNKPICQARAMHWPAYCLRSRKRFWSPAQPIWHYGSQKICATPPHWRFYIRQKIWRKLKIPAIISVSVLWCLSKPCAYGRKRLCRIIARCCDAMDQRKCAWRPHWVVISPMDRPLETMRPP